MTTPAHGNFTGSASKPPDGAFEAFQRSGLSSEEAERLAASFKPSWEFDEAPFAQGAQGIDASQLDSLAAGGIASYGAANGANGNGNAHPNGADSRLVAPHAPPQRVETHEPEVSVIIDRSITAAEMDAQRDRAAPAGVVAPPPSARAQAPVVSPFAAASFTSPSAAPQRVAPVMRGPRTADESLQLPATLKKSNKGLFIGLGVAVAAAVLVLVVHGAMTSSDAPSSTSSDTAAAATATPPAVAAPAAQGAQGGQAQDSRDRERAASIPLPPTSPTPPAPATPVIATTSVSSLPLATSPLPAPQRSAAAPRSQPHSAPVVHRAPAPRNPPKPAAGGIVRDVPF